MAWTINSVRIYTQDFPETTKNIIARLQPVDAGTTLQHFGWENVTYKLSGIIVGTVDKNAILALAQSSSSYTLSTPYGSITVFVNNATASQIYSICQTMRPDLASDAPVYKLDLELYV
jgi:hypothetical protein